LGVEEGVEEGAEEGVRAVQVVVVSRHANTG
jgi:hypothetical protein